MRSPNVDYDGLCVEIVHLQTVHLQGAHFGEFSVVQICCRTRCLNPTSQLQRVAIPERPRRILRSECGQQTAFVVVFDTPGTDQTRCYLMHRPNVVVFLFVLVTGRDVMWIS